MGHRCELPARQRLGREPYSGWEVAAVPATPAGDPFAEALGFTNRAARVMRLSGFVPSTNKLFEENFWYDDVLPRMCAQSGYDTEVVASVLTTDGKWRAF